MRAQKRIPFADERIPGNEYIASDKDGEAGWRVLSVKMGGRIVDRMRSCLPTLTALLEDIPELHNVAISILDAHKQIPVHDGYFKGYLRYMLGIYVPHPDKCVLYVNGTPQRWQEGQGFVFDDMFQHEVYNVSEDMRVVLYADLVRTMPNAVLQSINQYVVGLVEASPIMKELQAAQETPVEYEKL